MSETSPREGEQGPPAGAILSPGRDGCVAPDVANSGILGALIKKDMYPGRGTPNRVAIESGSGVPLPGYIVLVHGYPGFRYALHPGLPIRPCRDSG